MNALSYSRISLMLCMLCMLALLTACGGSPPTAFYTLESKVLSPAKELSATNTKKMPKIVLQEVKVPAYLDRNGITLREADGVTLTISDFNSWGENIADGARRVLSDVLMNTLLEREVLLLSLDDDSADAKKIFVFLHRLDGTIGGKVTIDARWTVHTYDNNELVSGAFVDSMSAGTTYATLVKAQSALLVKLAEHMTSPIADALQEK